MGYFPFFMDVEGKKCVLAGGGRVAERKCRKLLPFGPQITAVSPAFSDEMKRLAEQSRGQVSLVLKKAEEADLADACFVIAATDDAEVNGRLCEFCRRKNIPVNDANEPQLGTFLFPALAEDQDVVIGITTGGKSPAASAFLQKKVEQCLPEGIGRSVSLLGRLREEIEKRPGSQPKRAERWNRLLDECIAREGRMEIEELRARWEELEGADHMEAGNKIRLGTRGSRLALVQEKMAGEAIRSAWPELETECIIRKTRGDQILDQPFSEIGDKGLFAAEFEIALQNGEIDAAVHSAKDLPMKLAEGLCIGAVLPRADVRDVLAVRSGGGKPQEGVPYVLGTGSQRRASQAEKCWPQITCRMIRGNVETRLKKLENREYDGILLAKAGLDRLGITEETHPQFRFFPLDPNEFLPAACQGIVALETTEGSTVEERLRKVSDPETELAFRVERYVLDLLGADCSEPAGAWCRMEEDQLLLDVMYGSRRSRRSTRFAGTEADPEKRLDAGRRMAEEAAKEVREPQV